MGLDECTGMESLPSVPVATNCCVVDETSPDLLKNTPTNIARLEDVIEHCIGRQKYLAQTRSPSDGGDLRWYFCKVPLGLNDLAASVPQTEIVEKGDYFRFGVRDSLAIEASFLQMEEDLLSSWWKEYAESSQGPSELPSSGIHANPQETSFPSGPESSKSYVIVEDERVGVPVKGGLYEVDLVKRHCFPVYWDGENRRVLRGHWFARKSGIDWLPLREDVSEQLEFAYRKQIWHRRTFQPSGLFAARVDLQGSTPGLHALFTGEDDTWEAWLNADAYGLSSVIGLSRNAIKLRRGYYTAKSAKPTQDEKRQQKEEEMDDYCSQVPVRHVVFMVHGIGQRLEKSNLVDDVGNFRVITGRLAELHLSSYKLNSQRVIFIPCQWRRGLKLSGEAAVDKITLDGVRSLRVMLSATVHDVLYYMSPIYCQDIINSVSNQLNRLYWKFLKRNRGYDGKVSIYGHSLGSVLSYDILCHQENLSSPFPMEWMYKENMKNKDPLLDVGDPNSNCNPSMNMEDECSRVSHDSEGRMESFNEDRTGAQSASSTQRVQASEYFSLVSDLKGASEETLDPMHQNTGLSFEEDVHAHNVESFSEETSDKFKSTSLWMEEIACLKARIAELESKCAVSSKGYIGVHKTLPKESLPGYFQPLPDCAPSYRPYIKYTRLDFKVDTFFAVGSPLGVFLALRNVRIGIGKGQDYWKNDGVNEEMPACSKMFNIFHPFDPVAYRIEPLVCSEYTEKRPVIIPYHKGGKRLHIGFQDFTEDLSARSRALVDHLNFVTMKVLTICQSKSENSLEDATKVDEEEERSYGCKMMERLSGSADGRIDHMLQDKTFEHAYISAIGAHTNYWRDYDTALFILKQLYGDVADEWKSWKEEADRCDQKGVEEQSLTFSKNVLSKNPE